MFRIQSAVALAIIGAAISIPVTANAASFTYSLNPKATFLRTNRDPFAVDPFILDLSDIGVSSGQEIFLQALGDYAVGGAFGDGSNVMVGVFSSTNELLPSDVFQRVPGALDAVTSRQRSPITSPTGIGGFPTNIEEDFGIPTVSITAIVPNEAQYLFIGTPDRFNGDNHDPDGDYGVRIVTPSRYVPEPSILLGTAIATALGWRYSRKRS